MSVLLSHPTGNANVRNTLLAFHEASILRHFVTTVAAFEDNFFGKIANTRIGAELKRRSYDSCLSPYTRQYPAREIGRQLSGKMKLHFLSSKEDSPFSVQRMYREIDCRAASLLKKNPSTRAVYSYEDGALESFLTAKDLGIKTLYELPTTYWRTTREILSEEAMREPEWASTILALNDSDEKLDRKDRELSGADHIIVPSRFCAESVINSDLGAKAPVIVPYGCPMPIQLSERVERATNDKIRLLFVGNLSQGKGLSYLFDAVRQLKGQVELTIIGKRVSECKRLDQELKSHNWLGTMPHSEVLRAMEKHDVFVFPSLLEGFGMVITEALSRGLPVITTTNTCAPDLIEDGSSGFIVSIRDASAIARQINMLYHDREKLFAMKQAAIEVARRNSWQNYRQKISEFATTLLKDA